MRYLYRFALFTFLSLFIAQAIWAQSVFTKRLDYRYRDTGISVTEFEDGRMALVSLSDCLMQPCARVWILDNEAQPLFYYDVGTTDSFFIRPQYRIPVFQVDENSYAVFLRYNSQSGPFGFTKRIVFSEVGEEESHIISPENKNEYIISAEQGSDGYYTFSHKNISLHEGEMIFRKIDEGNNVLLEKSHSENNFNRTINGNLIPLDDGGYLYANTYETSDNQAETLWGRRDAQGEILWEHQNTPHPGSYHSDRNSRITLTAENKVIIGEYFNDYGQVENPITGMYGDYVIHSYSLDGEEEWQQVIQYDPGQEILQIYPAANGDIIGVGTIRAVNFFGNEPGFAYDAAWLFRMNAQGEMLWERNHLISNATYADLAFNDVIELEDGRIAIASTYWYINSPGSSIVSDAWLLITDSEGCLDPACGENVLVNNRAIPQPSAITVEITPNPARDQVHIQMPGLGKEAVLEIIDLQGRRLYRSPFNGELRVDVSELPRTLMLVHIYGPDGVISKKVVLE